MVAAAPPAIITAESAFPANNTPDPGETVTANFPLVNNGTGNTTNLVATLQNSGGVTPVTTSQNYGVVVAAGPTVSRPFTFVASGACGGSITATLHLQDGVTDLGNVTYTFPLGTTSSSTQTFTSSTLITIPASGTGATSGAPATPYPSTILVSGVPTTISKVTVTLSNMTHTFPGDVDVLLVSPTGRKFILVSDVIGDSNWTGQTYTFDDNAVALLPSSGAAPATGTYKPTNIGSGDLFPAPAPAAPYLSPATDGTDTLTSAFTGVAGGDPNGTWSLYVVDDFTTDAGTFGGWSISFTLSTPVCAGPVAAASVKTHPGFGSFPVALPLVGTTGIECRTTGGTNDYQMVVTFNAGGYNVTGAPQAQVTSGTATIGTGGVANGGAVTFDGPHQVCTIPLTNVGNAQTITVRLNNVNDGVNSGNVVIPMSILIGDINAVSGVTGGDVNLCKAQVGAPSITFGNFRNDVNANGSITGGDVNVVKAQIGTSLPP